MQQYIRNHEVSTSNNNENKSAWTVLGNGVVALVLAIALLYSSGIVAAENDMSGQSQAMISSDGAIHSARVDIDRAEMDAKTKKSKMRSDAQIGAFSMEDGAMEGFYGDGVYGD